MVGVTVRSLAVYGTQYGIQRPKIMAKIAIVGNGPARELYKEFDGDVCLCNIPQLDTRYDYISIVDRKAIDYIQNTKSNYDKPILTTQQLKDLTVKWKWTTEVKPVFEKKLMNSAATAAYYFAQHYDTVYLYGCNALWSNVVTSHQDEIIPRSTRASNLHEQWRKHWREVWQTKKEFVIVHPPEIKAEDYGENVLWYSIRT